MGEKKVRKQKMKTRCYYTDYVNHAIRFFLSTPDTLQVQGKRKADVENWVAVQAVFHQLTDDEKKVLTDVFNTHYNLPHAVETYCQNTGTDEYQVWVLITKVSSRIAKCRGLI